MSATSLDRVDFAADELQAILNRVDEQIDAVHESFAQIREAFEIAFEELDQARRELDGVRSALVWGDPESPTAQLVERKVRGDDFDPSPRMLAAVVKLARKERDDAR